MYTLNTINAILKNYSNQDNFMEVQVQTMTTTNLNKFH